MFKKTLFALGLSVIAATAMAATEGTDYVKLDKPMVNAEGKLTKIFSYDCPFCFKYDVGVDPKVLPRIEKELGLAFNPVHLETKGKYGRVASEFLAMCMLKDKAAGVSIESKDSLFKKAKDAIYQAYHKKGERWTSGEAAFLKTLTDATGLALTNSTSEKRRSRQSSVRRMEDLLRRGQDPGYPGLCRQRQVSDHDQEHPQFRRHGQSGQRTQGNEVNLNSFLFLS